MNRLPVDAEAIRALAEILRDTGLSEIEIAEKDSRIRVVRAVSVSPAAAPTATVAHSAEAAAPAASDIVDLSQHAGAVKSPMVGIAYLAPEPGAPPFVTVGQQVAVGQTLMLIEAMKTYNQIKAPRAGTLARICITSGVPVEYDEVLMVID